MWQAETSSGCEVPWIEKGSAQAPLPESTGRHSGENCPARECLRRDTGPEAGRPSNRPERLHSPVSSACQATGTARGKYAGFTTEAQRTQRKATPTKHPIVKSTPAVSPQRHRGHKERRHRRDIQSSGAQPRFHHRGTENTEKGVNPKIPVVRAGTCPSPRRPRREQCQGKRPSGMADRRSRPSGDERHNPGTNSRRPGRGRPAFQITC